MLLKDLDSAPLCRLLICKFGINIDIKKLLLSIMLSGNPLSSLTNNKTSSS